jgi:hypothetical protein
MRFAMKNIKGKFFNVFMAILAALAGYLLAGCDGSVAQGDGSSPLTCEGAQEVNVVISGSQYTISDNITAQCVGWTAMRRYYGNGTVDSCVRVVAALGFTTEQAKVECTTPLTKAECADVAHDRVDTAGIRHCFLVGDPPAAHYPSYQVLLGIDVVTSSTGTQEICSDGTYVGRSCAW